MLYVAIKNKVGYETYLAESDDLLAWRPLGKVLPFAESGWDQWQADGSLALVDPSGTARRSCSSSTASIGCRISAARNRDTNPIRSRSAWPGPRRRPRPKPWTRLAENPVLTPLQPDARPFEKATLYKSHILWDKSETLGCAVRDVLQRQAARPRHRADRHGGVEGHGALEALRRRAGDRQRQRHLGRPADCADGRLVGDVLLRRVLAAGRVRHVRLLARPGALDQVDRSASDRAVGAVGQDVRPQAVDAQARRRGVPLLLCGGHGRAGDRTRHVARSAAGDVVAAARQICGAKVRSIRLASTCRKPRLSWTVESEPRGAEPNGVRNPRRVIGRTARQG